MEVKNHIKNHIPNFYAVLEAINNRVPIVYSSDLHHNTRWLDTIKKITGTEDDTIFIFRTETKFGLGYTYDDFSKVFLFYIDPNGKIGIDNDNNNNLLETKHSDLSDKDDGYQHKISSIEGLEEQLENLKIEDKYFLKKPKLESDENSIKILFEVESIKENTNQIDEIEIQEVSDINAGLMTPSMKKVLDSISGFNPSILNEYATISQLETLAEMIIILQEKAKNFEDRITALEEEKGEKLSGETLKASLRDDFEYKNQSDDLMMNVLQYADRQPSSWVGSIDDFDNMEESSSLDGVYYILNE